MLNYLSSEILNKEKYCHIVFLPLCFSSNCRCRWIINKAIVFNDWNIEIHFKLRLILMITAPSGYCNAHKNKIQLQELLFFCQWLFSHCGAFRDQAPTSGATMEEIKSCQIIKSHQKMLESKQLRCRCERKEASSRIFNFPFSTPLQVFPYIRYKG